MDGDLHNVLFNLKFTSKQLSKSASKAEKDSDKEKKKIADCLAKGNPEAARIYAETAIRKKNEYLNLLRLSARLDAAASRVQTAIQMKQVTKAMGMTVKGMDKVLQSMDPLQITSIMDKFEQQTGNMDVALGSMDSAFNNAESSTVPTAEVDSLLEQLKAEQTHQVGAQIANAAGKGLDPLELEEKEMTERLQRLKAQNM